jgi:hypothetical protein
MTEEKFQGLLRGREDGSGGNLLDRQPTFESIPQQSPDYQPETPSVVRNDWTLEEIIQLAQEDQEEINAFTREVLDPPQYGNHFSDDLVSATIDLTDDLDYETGPAQ